MATEVTLSVRGMTCQHCVQRVQKALSQVTGVESATVDLETGRAQVRGQNLETADLIRAVEEAGYRAGPEQN
ncbi:MAG: heavy-metal-associated domain-containing protein [Deltaproteobacteria bacterium]|nr:heavy-metal-associated domain-containing protein [Deltaproteobacteria bacterium]